jgi:predicted HicB family RNase H-like nuclease
MGRPRKGEEKHRSASLRFRVKEDVDARLRALAQSSGASIADVAEEALNIGIAQIERRKQKSRHSSKAAA